MLNTDNNTLEIGKEYLISELLDFVEKNQNSIIIETKPEIDFYVLQYNKNMRCIINTISTRALTKIINPGKINTEKWDIYQVEIISIPN
jgi:hypothetical protein